MALPVVWQFPTPSEEMSTPHNDWSQTLYFRGPGSTGPFHDRGEGASPPQPNIPLGPQTHDIIVPRNRDSNHMSTTSHIDMRLCMTPWVYIWVYCFLCEYMGIYASLWVSIWIYRYLCESIDFYMNLWLFMWAYGSIFESINLYVTMWVSMWVYGFM